MTAHFYDRIQLQVVTLYEPRLVATMSFKYHKSVNPLDLSMNEYGLRQKSIFTREEIRKRFQPQRQIMYKYNLDLPADFNKCYTKEKFDVVKENAFHQYGMLVSNSVYNSRFEKYIVQAINSQRASKIEKLKRLMQIIKRLDFNRFSTPAMYLYDNILPILLEEGCSDSKLVVNFTNLFSFYLWITNRENPHLLQYVLENAQKVQSSLSLSLFREFRIDPINACFLRHKITQVPVLLRFGAYSAFPRAFNFNTLLKFSERLWLREIRRRIADTRRAFFLFQLFYDFRYHRNSPEGLRCMWRCIDDPFLSLTEIASAFIPRLGQELPSVLVAYYQHSIIEQVCSSNPSPRTLKHICRFEVRRLLNFNNQLPFGVYGLDVPFEIKMYLNLFT